MFTALPFKPGPLHSALIFAGETQGGAVWSSRHQDRLFDVWCRVVQNAPTLPPPTAMTQSKPIRLTISVTPEVHAGFERLASASGMSMSRCMGEWLADTLDAVEYTASMVEKARLAPKLVMREVHAYALGLADETGAILGSLRKGQSIKEALDEVPSIAPTRMSRRAAGDLPEAGAGRPAAVPPSCNTGGKLPHSPVRDAGRHAAAPKGKIRSAGGKS